MAAYVALTKPRIIELLLVTTVPTMVVAAHGPAAAGARARSRCAGGTLAAGGANAINMVVDRDIDRLMQRTQDRPLVTGEITPRAALVFAIGLEVAAFALLWWQVNLLSAVLAVSACLFYVFVYTLWLKRRSEHNIVIGGAAGAVPVLVGWAAVTGSLDWAPVVLFAIIFYWTPPHFWALAIRYRDDYSGRRRADAPVGARRQGGRRPDPRLHAAALGPHPAVRARSPTWAPSTSSPPSCSAPSSPGWRCSSASDSSPKMAMRLFGYSITYITLLFGAMAVDQLVRFGA